ncbi:uncharacterized protein CXQ87_001254 [Candidozyma duobushaemuli]|uniref:Uncharacterized protein n=2 Tax=Candidozyma TaxID=3303203 RepID=A0ABX8I1A8_9ASCO|nr:uncharacterized protein CXQ87_001254 [[Candida] duobushaemulonis]PVH18331.1 hypothetical protein CXQ87_001254 [[Candida] duobushaemulonis]QWU86879.1 hypothetical protein CA3LBN_001097 [[Candida] haemuloni]
MAKKVSKHSRAARRGEINLDGEAKSLATLAKGENSDVRKSIIRTTIKNENLLAKKMENDAIRKKSNKRKTSALKHKLDRNSKLDGVLASKIQQSIDRAKYVQTARKSGWDQINKGLNVRPVEDLKKQDKPKSEEEMAMDEEDAYVEEFFKDTKPEEEEAQKAPKPDQNAFALLEETEA